MIALLFTIWFSLEAVHASEDQKWSLLIGHMRGDYEFSQNTVGVGYRVNSELKLSLDHVRTFEEDDFDTRILSLGAEFQAQERLTLLGRLARTQEPGALSGRRISVAGEYALPLLEELLFGGTVGLEIQRTRYTQAGYEVSDFDQTNIEASSNLGLLRWLNVYLSYARVIYGNESALRVLLPTRRVRNSDDLQGVSSAPENWYALGIDAFASDDLSFSFRHSIIANKFTANSRSYNLAVTYAFAKDFSTTLIGESFSGDRSAQSVGLDITLTF